MKENSIKKIISTAKIIILGLFVAMGMNYAMAFIGPTASAPGGNVPAPINIGIYDQVKDAGLSVNAFLGGGDGATSSFWGNVEIGSDVADVGAKDLYVYGDITSEGDITSAMLENEGPGMDLTLKSAADDWYPTMLCADTNGKIVLCKDLPAAPYVEGEYTPISIDLTPNNIAEATTTIGCNQDNYSFSTSISGTDTTPTYLWSVVKTAGPGVGIFWSPATFSGSSEDASFYRDSLSTRTYSITVTATDDEGNTDSDSASINIQSVSWYETVELGGGAVCPD